MKKLLNIALVASLVGSLSLAQAETDSKSTIPANKTAETATHTPSDVRLIPMINKAQPYDLAAKLQWNPHDKRWDKVLVLYNGAATPPIDHPVWAYFKALGLPDRAPSKPGENLAYRPFHANAYCDGTTPLTNGKAMRVSFDDDALGIYGEKDYFRDWNCPKWGMGLKNLEIVNGQESRTGKDKTLRVKLLKGLSGCVNDLSCINWKPQIGQKFDSLYYSYWVKFPENFDPVLGGKLPGIGNENARTGGGKPTGHDGWSVRVMWDRHAKLGQYVYHMDQRSHFGDFLEWKDTEIQKGKWQQIKTYVKLNSPNKSDGVIKTWVDGKPVLDKRDLRFQTGDNLKIERFLFSVFYGGSGPEWAPAFDNVIYLDDFTISPQPL